MSDFEYRIGTAAWAVPKTLGGSFPSDGTHLERYSNVLNAVEINTSFYRDHKAETYAKWANSTPENFEFCVKISKVFTHDQQLEVDAGQLKQVLQGIMHLGPKLRVILVQLPPKLEFKSSSAQNFFRQMRSLFLGPIVIEPRHKSWVSPEAFLVLKEFEISKVIADPEPCPASLEFQSVSKELVYIRWHGSPVIYESRYEQDQLFELEQMARHLSKMFKTVWIIFDNTTFAWATVNALETKALMNKERRSLGIGFSSSI